jgi:hypothetical protein
MALTCSKCGAIMGSTARFCSSCGAPIGEGAATAPASARPPVVVYPSPRASGARAEGSPVGRVRARLPVLPLAVLFAGVLALLAAIVTVRVTPPPAAGAALVMAAATPAPAAPILPPLEAAEAVAPVATGASVPVSRPTALPTRAPVVVPVEERPTAAPLPTAVPTPTPPIVAVFECRRAAEFNVDPEEAEVAIDGRVIGIADEWDGAGGGSVWVFPGSGEYYARFSLEGYETAWVKIMVMPGARRDVADIDTDLVKIRKRKR